MSTGKGHTTGDFAYAKGGRLTVELTVPNAQGITSGGGRHGATERVKARRGDDRTETPASSAPK